MSEDMKVRLTEEFKDDNLFKYIHRRGLDKYLFTDLILSLDTESTYSTVDAGKILEKPDSTIRNHFRSELVDYIQPTKLGKYYRLDYKSIFKLHMIFILLEKESRTTIDILDELGYATQALQSKFNRIPREKSRNNLGLINAEDDKDVEKDIFKRIDQLQNDVNLYKSSLNHLLFDIKINEYRTAISQLESDINYHRTEIVKFKSLIGYHKSEIIKLNSQINILESEKAILNLRITNLQQQGENNYLLAKEEIEKTFNMKILQAQAKKRSILDVLRSKYEFNFVEEQKLINEQLNELKRKYLNENKDKIEQYKNKIEDIDKKIEEYNEFIEKEKEKIEEYNESIKKEENQISILESRKIELKNKEQFLLESKQENLNEHKEELVKLVESKNVD